MTGAFEFAWVRDTACLLNAGSFMVFKHCDNLFWSVPAAVITPFPAGPWSFRNAGES